MAEQQNPEAPNPEVKTVLPNNSPIAIPKMACARCADELRIEVRTFGNKGGNKQVCGVDAYCDTCHYHAEIAMQYVMSTIDTKWKPPMAKDVAKFEAKKKAV